MQKKLNIQPKLLASSLLKGSKVCKEIGRRDDPTIEEPRDSEFLLPLNEMHILILTILPRRNPTHHPFDPLTFIMPFLA